MTHNTAKHDNLVEIVEKHCYLYEKTKKFVEYSFSLNGKWKAGEIDLLAFRPGVISIYEIKSTNKTKNRIKAIAQLNRAEQYFLSLGDKRKIHKVYVTPKYVERFS